MSNVDSQYADLFRKDGAKIGSVLRIRLPADYTLTDGPGLPLPVAAKPDLLPSVSEVATVGAATVLAKNPVVSRRFWAR